MISGRRLIIKFIITATIILIIYNEFIVYYINSMNFKSLKCTQPVNCTKMLLVADPQILGINADKSFYSSLAVWDSDRFLKKTFDVASGFTKPDVVIFLGDLLDEGSSANEAEFNEYVGRFKSIFSNELYNKKIHLPGDNDIGGEDGEYISNENIRRFQIDFENNDILDFEYNIRFFKINRMQLTYSNPDQKNNAYRIRVGLSHVPILISGGTFMRNILSELDPHVIFSAHWHDSRLGIYPSAHFKKLYTNEINVFNLEDLKVNHKFLEIIVPTSSYRMGTDKIGYGYAIIDGDKLHYTVLWNTSRFPFLIIYLVWLCTSMLLIITLKIFTRFPIRISRRNNNKISLLPPF